MPLKQSMSGCKRLLFLSTPSLISSAALASAVATCVQLKVHASNGLTWFLLKEPCRPVCLPATGHALPLQLSILEATMRADLTFLTDPPTHPEPEVEGKKTANFAQSEPKFSLP